ncbi:MAG: hypothetical protein ACTSVL_02100 [Promethearchaeota archaeon]
MPEIEIDFDTYFPSEAIFFKYYYLLGDVATHPKINSEFKSMNKNFDVF